MKIDGLVIQTVIPFLAYLFVVVILVFGLIILIFFIAPLLFWFVKEEYDVRFNKSRSKTKTNAKR